MAQLILVSRTELNDALKASSFGFIFWMFCLVLRCSAYLLYLELSRRDHFSLLSFFQNVIPKGTLCFFKNSIIMQYGSHKLAYPCIRYHGFLQCDMACHAGFSEAKLWLPDSKCLTVFYCLSSMLFIFGLCIQGNHQLLTCVDSQGIWNTRSWLITCNQVVYPGLIAQTCDTEDVCKSCSWP